MAVEILNRIDQKVQQIHDTVIDGDLTRRIARLEAALFSGSGPEVNITSAKLANLLRSANYAAGSAGWQIDKFGNMEINDLLARGTVSSFVYTPGSTGWQINEDGTAEFNAVTIRGGVFAGSGTISGTLQVGTGSPHILIGGANALIKTSDFSSGLQGWQVDKDGNAEFNKIVARGEIRSLVLTYNEQSAIAGALLVVKSAGVLRTDFTSVTSPTPFDVDIEDPSSGHVQLFAVNDILRLKIGSADNWIKVFLVSDQTTFFRYTCVLMDGTPATWQAGTAVLNYGQSGDGGLLLTADDTNAPHLSIFTHAGSPWSATTTRACLGNLNGSFGISSKLFGIGLGDYSGGTYLRYDPTNGLVLKGGEDQLTIDSLGLMFEARQSGDGGPESGNMLRWNRNNQDHLIIIAEDQYRYVEAFAQSAGYSSILEIFSLAPTPVDTGVANIILVAGRIGSLTHGSPTAPLQGASIHLIGNTTTTTEHIKMGGWGASDAFAGVVIAAALVGTKTPNAMLDVRGDAIFNEDGADKDFRIEGDADPNLVFVDASVDRVGIGTNTPGHKLHIAGNVRADTAFMGLGGNGANYAHFSHEGMTAAGQYALLQSYTGTTFLNTAAGNTGYIRVGNVDAARWKNDRLEFVHPVMVSSPIWARVTHSTTQTAANGVFQALAFNQERADTDAIHDTVTNNSRLTAKTAGLYYIQGIFTWDAVANGARQAFILYNGTTYIAAYSTDDFGLADSPRMSVACLYYLNANDYVQLIARQTSGGTVTILKANEHTPEFMMVRLI